jgi:hypothetical protein
MGKKYKYFIHKTCKEIYRVESNEKYWWIDLTPDTRTDWMVPIDYYDADGELVLSKWNEFYDSEYHKEISEAEAFIELL